MTWLARVRGALLAFVIPCSLCASIGMTSGQVPYSSRGSDELLALLKRMEVSRRANEDISALYTYDGTLNCKTYDTKGTLKREESQKWVTFTLDGVTYRRIVEENGRPLSEKKQIAEQKRSDQTGKLGKDYDFIFQFIGLNPRDYIYSDLPVSYLDTLFDNRLIGHEIIDGRDNLVIESTPNTDAHPGNDRAKSALDWREKTWIDVEDAVPSRYDIELLNKRDYLQKGSTFSVEFTRLPITESGNSRLPSKVWLIQTENYRLLCRILWEKSSDICEHHFYNYKKVRADEHVVEDSVRELPATGAGKQP